MTDESNDKRDELVLDWDDAVDSWGQELDSSAKAEAEPFPTRAEEPSDPRTRPAMPLAPAASIERPTVTPPGPFPSFPMPAAPRRTTRPFEARPEPTAPPPPLAPSVPRAESARPRMYKPPTPAELAASPHKGNGTKTLPPPFAGPQLTWEDDDGESTQIAAIPRELIEALARADAHERDAASRTETRDARPVRPVPSEPSLDFDPPPGEVHDTDPIGLVPPRDASGVFTPGDLRSGTPARGVESKLPSMPSIPSLPSIPSAPSAPTAPPPAPEASTPAPEGPLPDTLLSIEPDSFSFSDVPEALGGAGDVGGLRIIDLSGDELIQLEAPPKPPVPNQPPRRSTDRPRAPSVRPPPPAPRVPEVSVLRNLEELAPPSERPAAPQTVLGVVPAAEDRGALAALNTVRSKKPRVESLPLTAADDAGKRARIELFEAIAAKQAEHKAANALIAAAELAEELGDIERARSLYQGAVQKAPRLVAPLRALARLALAQGDVAGYLDAFERQAALPSSAQVKSRALAVCARIRWLLQRDFPAALRAATEAERLLPDELGYALLLARIEAAGHPTQFDATMAVLARRTSDALLAAPWLVAAGRAREARGDLPGAREAYERALAFDAHALDAHLAIARVRLAQGDRTGTARALLALLPALPQGAVTEAARRRAALLLGRDEPSRAEALALVNGASDVASLRTSVRLAAGVEADLREQVVRSWVTASTGSERALALVNLAELLAQSGAGEDAERALDDAIQSDPTVQLISVVREVLAHGRGDRAAAAQATGGEERGPLAAAAKLADDRSGIDHEITWLLRARAAQIEPTASATLLLDACAEALDVERVRTLLRAEAERDAAPADRAAALMALSDVDKRAGAADDAQQWLAQAIELDPRNTVAARAYVRSLPAPAALARVFRREAEASSGVRAASLLLRAGNALSDDNSGRLAAFVSAYEAAPGYAPAVWALHHEARRQGDLLRLSDLHGREAGRTKDSHAAVGHLVRAALVRAGADTDAAAAQLTRALDLMPSDPVLRELVIRLGDAVPATLRAEALQRSAERAPEWLERPCALSAASAFEDAHQPARAAQVYELVLRKHPGDPIAEMGLERVASAAGKASDLLDAKQRTLSRADSTAARVKALEGLLELTEPSAESLGHARAILAEVPDHSSALRRLERDAMERNDVDLLFDLELQMTAASRGTRDRVARLRTAGLLCMLLAPDRGRSEHLDRLLAATGLDATQGVWLGRQLMGAAVALDRRDALVHAVALLQAHTQEPAELAALAVQRIRCLSENDPGRASARPELEQSLAKFPSYPTGLELLAELQLAADEVRAAAENFEHAARNALHGKRAARLWHRAGTLFQDQLQSPDRARDALQQAAQADLGYADVRARLESLLSGRNDLAGLIALTETRVKASQTPEQKVELERQLAKLYDKQGERAKAVACLRSALDSAPENLGLLRELAQLHERENEHRECAEVLIRVARLSRDPAELGEAFFRLGEIYDLHLPDARRAEAAYRRVLKLAPKHLKALERLAALHKREAQTEQAVQALEQLMQSVDAPARKREVAFEIAKLKEDHGDRRGAEEALEQLRRSAPTDITVLRSLAEFYRRTGAQSALAMHLNRASNDLRHALEADFDDAGLWTAIVEVLSDKGRRDAARACASSAFALGLADASVAGHVDGEGNMPGAGGAAFSELLDDLVFPDLLPASLRIVFRHGAEALNKAAPFELRSLGAEKLDRKHPLRALVQELQRWASISDVEIYVTNQLPLAFVPIGDAPVQLLVGQALLSELSRGEQLFLVARALKMARAQMSLTCRVRPEEIGVLIKGLIRSQYPDYAPAGADLAALDAVARRVGKHVTRRARDEMLSHLVELAGSPGVDVSRAYVLASTAGNRAGLLATGSVPSALSALAKLSGLPVETRLTASAVTQAEEAKDLLRFAISEAHFEARQRAGADQR